MKVSIATTLKEGLVVDMRSMPGNPYDGHTLAETLEQVGILTGTDSPPRHGHRGQGLSGRGDQGRAHPAFWTEAGSSTKTLKAMIKKRHRAGHWTHKVDGRLARNPLKGALGDALHTVMCGVGHNLRLIWPRCGFYTPDSAYPGSYRSTGRRTLRPPTGLRLRTELLRAD